MTPTEINLFGIVHVNADYNEHCMIPSFVVKIILNLATPYFILLDQYRKVIVPIGLQHNHMKEKFCLKLLLSLGYSRVHNKRNVRINRIFEICLEFINVLYAILFKAAKIHKWGSHRKNSTFCTRVP